MKRIVTVIFLIATLTSCGKTDGAEDGNTENTPETHYTFWQETPGGRVLCVWAKSGYGGGLSCDWAHAK